MFGIKTKIITSANFIKWHLLNYWAYLNQKQNIETYIKRHRIRKLNLGCWPYTMPGWLNTDLYGNETVVPLDLTKKFPIKSNAFHYIFCEHTIEHFTYSEGTKILLECARVLKPGGKIRIATPDFGFLTNLYSKNKTETQKKYINWAGREFMKAKRMNADTFIINNFFRAWGHKFIYDYKTLKRQLKNVSFSNIKRFRPGISKDPTYQDIEMHWKSIGSKDFNNLETFVVEAEKLDFK